MATQFSRYAFYNNKPLKIRGLSFFRNKLLLCPSQESCGEWGAHVILFWIRLGMLSSLLLIPRSCGSQRKSKLDYGNTRGSALRLIPLQLVIANELR